LNSVYNFKPKVVRFLKFSKTGLCWRLNTIGPQTSVEKFLLQNFCCKIFGFIFWILYWFFFWPQKFRSDHSTDWVKDRYRFIKAHNSVGYHLKNLNISSENCHNCKVVKFRKIWIEDQKLKKKSLFLKEITHNHNLITKLQYRKLTVDGIE
jgi:hypothetical protein